jgi:hypothetical protein
MTFSAMALGITDTKRQYIGIATSGGNMSTVWDFSTAGFGTRYTAASGNRPSSTQAWGVSFNPSNSALSYVGVGGLAVYPWPPTGSNFRTKYTDPVDMPTTGDVGTQFSPSGKVLAIGRSVYAWSSTGFGTKYADPSTSFISDKITFSPSEDAIASININSPYVQAFAWNNSTGFGAKYSDPATLPPSSTTSVAFNPSGNDIALTNVTSGSFITVYPWSNGFGTKYSNPATPPTNNGQDVKFSPSGRDIAIAHTTSPAITAYPWTSGTGFGTKYSNPASAVSGNGTSVAFSRSGNTIGVGHSSTPFVSAYTWTSGVGFGTRYTSPSTLPAGTVNSVVFG